MHQNYRKYLKANPWRVHNVSSNDTACGRFPTREDAVAHGRTYRGGIVSVDDANRVVYVSEVYSV